MINVGIYQGRLVANPERKKTTGDEVFITFTLAVPRAMRKKDGRNADFFDCIAWGKDAETIYKYVFQGDGLTVKGRTETNDYIDRNGVKRRSYTLVVEDWEFGPKKKTEDVENITPSPYSLSRRR